MDCDTQVPSGGNYPGQNVWKGIIRWEFSVVNVREKMSKELSGGIFVVRGNLLPVKAHLFE